MQGSFTTQRDLRAFDAENARIAAGGAERGANRASGEETQFHQSVSEIVRQIEVEQRGGLSAAELSQTPKSGLV